MLPVLWQKIDADGTPQRNLNNHWLSKFHEYVKIAKPKNVSYHLVDEGMSGIFPIEVSLSGYQHIAEMMSNIDDVAEKLRNTSSVVLLWMPEEIDEWLFNSPTMIGISKKFKASGVRVVTVCSDMHRKNNLNFDEIASPRFSINIFDQATKNCLKNEGFLGKDAIKSQPKKHYICLNNKIVASKLYVLSQLASKELLDKGHVSALNSIRAKRYEKIFDFLDRSYLSIDDRGSRLKDINGFIETHLSYDDTPPRVPLTLDVKGEEFDPWGFYYAYNNKPFSRLLPYHNDACISIVDETEASWIKNHQFSEKIYIPIAFKTPFMVVGNPGYLAHLRSQGFQTFPELFDESYDDIDDPIHRADMVLTELEKYCSKSIDDVKKIVDSVKEKLDYNQALFLSYKDYSLVFDELFNKLECFLRISNGCHQSTL